MIKRSLVSLAALSAVALTASACGSSGGETASGAQLVKDGTLTVCSDVPYAPFEDFDKSSSLGFKGFDIDIVNAVAKGMDLKLAVLDEDFNSLKSGLALNAGTCDLVASALTITDDRKKNLDFTDGYYDSKQSLLVPEGSSIKSIEDLAGKNVGVQQGTTGKDYAEKNAKGAKIVTFPSDAEEFQAIKAGQVDALLQDLPVNLTHEQAGGYTIVQQFDTDEEYGFAAKKGNDELVKEVDEQLAKLKKDGEYQKLYDKYFKVS
ncbi:transporter substrate-binding domain-containing protein [Nocardioides sp. DS6]|uniref:Transporter substrate-binding domain-containing protein n=1 Tax=Nocardioides eburneus TaxID=3231482 RepID=A0ABV3SYS5_9ACTN